MKNIHFIIFILVLSVGVVAGCTQDKEPEKKAKEEATQPVESAGVKPAHVMPEKVKEAAPVINVAETKEKVVEMIEAASGAADEKAATEIATASAGLKEGSVIFKSRCMACHGADGKGTAMAPAFQGNDWVNGADTSELANVIKNGRQGSEKKYKQFPIAMPAQKLNDKDISSLVAYLKSLASK